MNLNILNKIGNTINTKRESTMLFHQYSTSVITYLVQIQKDS